MAAYHGPNRPSRAVSIAERTAERTVSKEEEAVIYHALFSDNPTVLDAVHRLVVATKLAHGEDIAKDRQSLQHLLNYLTEQQKLLDVGRENLERERESIEAAARASGRHSMSFFALVCFGVLFLFFMVIGR